MKSYPAISRPLTDAETEEQDERAAIFELENHLSRQDANTLAYWLVIRRYMHSHDTRYVELCEKLGVAVG